MDQPVEIRRCEHRKTNGILCGSPALKDKPYCYFHDRYREQYIEVLDGTPIYQGAEITLPLLEDPNSIQMCLTKVIHMLMAGMLEPSFARTLIYGLQVAVQNLKNCNFAPKDEELGDNAPARADQRDKQGWGPTEVKAHEVSPEFLESISYNKKIELPAENEIEDKPEDNPEKTIPTIMAEAGRFGRAKLKVPSGRFWKEPQKKQPKPKPKINLFDRLAERREEYKRINGIT